MMRFWLRAAFMTDALNSFPGGFSVLMVVYSGDSSKLFTKALNSILANTLQPDEVVLVLNGELSSNHEDAISKAFSSIANDKINLIRLEKNIGLAEALNLGISNAKYNWIVRSDPDDYNLPNRFSSLSKMLVDDPTLELIGSYVAEVHDEIGTLYVRTVPLTLDRIKDYCRLRNPFNHMTVAYLRKLALDCGGYPKIYLKEDYGFWAKLIAQGVSAANLDRVLVIAMAGSEMIARRGGYKYVLSEFILQNSLRKLGYKGVLVAMQDGCLRGLIFLTPLTLRSLIYKFILRKPYKDLSK